jgi:FkbM family methyltransferase
VREVAKVAARRVFAVFGLNVTRKRPRAGRLGIDAMADIRSLLTNVQQATVFDVGANTGQSVKRFSELLPGCWLHAFEPSPTAFAQLRENTQRTPNLRLTNAGIGASAGLLSLIENDHSNMSSFLKLGEAGWGEIVRETPVPVITLDDYCADSSIEHIDLLKIDTQGYELEVLKGATTLLSEHRIGLLYLEIIFSNQYEGLPSFETLYGHLGRYMRLVAFYNFVVQDGTAGWCDALFTQPPDTWDPSGSTATLSY